MKWSAHYLHNKHCPVCDKLIADDSITCRNHRKYTEVQRKKISLSNIGKKHSIETRLRYSETRKGRAAWNKGIPGPRGELASNWKGGKKKINQEARSKLRKWRTEVLNRDNRTCKLCSKQEGILCAHHIESFSEFPELRAVLSNGITLCQSCHRWLHRDYHWFWIVEGHVEFLTKLI